MTKGNPAWRHMVSSLVTNKFSCKLNHSSSYFLYIYEWEDFQLNLKIFNENCYFIFVECKRNTSRFTCQNDLYNQTIVLKSYNHHDHAKWILIFVNSGKFLCRPMSCLQYNIIFTFPIFEWYLVLHYRQLYFLSFVLSMSVNL